MSPVVDVVVGEDGFLQPGRRVGRQSQACRTRLIRRPSLVGIDGGFRVLAEFPAQRFQVGTVGLPVGIDLELERPGGPPP